MGQWYDKWDENDAVFRSQRRIDKEDREQIEKGNLAKMIVPLTFAQIMTFISFNVMTLQQNRRFFELEPTGTEDNPLREPMELVLERDIRKNSWNAFLVQFFLDIGRFSLGVAEICYQEVTRKMRVPMTKTEDGPFGVPIETQTVDFQDIPVFVGNKVYPVSPYRWYPDVSLPLQRFQEGEYCGSEDMWSMSGLKGDGNLFNLDKIPKMSKKEFDTRKSISRIDEVQTRQNESMGANSSGGESDMVKSGSVVVTKIVLDIVPKDFEVEDGVSLGDEDFPVRYIVWYANDKTIVRFEEAYYLHCQFPYAMAQSSPDQHQLINESLADTCGPLASYFDWIANAHKASQANSLESKWVIDPENIDMKTVQGRSPFILMKKGASGTGVERYIKQFITTDVTQNALSEMGGLKELLESVTGFSGFMQGQSSPGRRSATQDKVVTQGASARGKLGLSCIWDSAFVSIGKQFIANNRQEMDADTFHRIVGNGPFGTAAMPIPVEELYSMFAADPVTIATSEDFFVFDGTLPSEKAFLAQSLQEILMEMLSNPQIAMVMGYGPQQFQQMMNDIYTLRGVTNARLPVPVATTQPAAPMGQPPQVLQLPPQNGGVGAA